MVLLLVGMLASVFNVQVSPTFGTYDVNHELNDYEKEVEALEATTLIQVLQSIGDGVDWEKAIYAGVLFNKKAKADLEALIDNYASAGDWQNVLKWTVICRKLGIEREDAIKAALDGLQMVGPLPRTALSGVYFCVEDKFALFGYYYAEKYNYRLDKWNKTDGYNFFKTVINNVSHPVLFIDANGNTVGYSRYYDESASTVQCFLIFYELGITDAFNDALYWWNWINDNFWYQNTHYKYSLSWADYECEAGFFAKIIANLKYYRTDLENWSRVLADLQNRFLIDKWDSKQWFSGSEGKTTYVVVHHYPSNPQRRLQNTIGAWTALDAVYWELNNASQNTMQDLLRGYGGLDPAWKLLMNPVASLYNNDTRKFRWESTSSLSEEATAYALTLMFLMGIVPKTAVLAFPLEEYTYEYIYDVDPELYSINLDNNSIRVSVVKDGELEFNYGASPVSCTFSSSGVYEIAFSNDWNSIVNISKLQDLPNNRRFLEPSHDVAIVNMTLPSCVLHVKEPITIQITVRNNGFHVETFNLSLTYTGTVDSLIGTQNLTLVPGESKTINFIWIPNRIGKYELKTYTSTIFNDSNPEDNIKSVFIYVLVIDGPYYTYDGMEYWIVMFVKHPVRLIFNW
mgnify:CR=1 FL=1